MEFGWFKFEPLEGEGGRRRQVAKNRELKN